MLKNKIIKPSCSEWSSPCTLVPKPDDTHQFLHRLHVVARADSHPLPRIEACIDYVRKGRHVTTLDLLKGYWRITLTERYKKLAAFVTPEGLYQHGVMLFGITNAPATLQRMIKG